MTDFKNDATTALVAQMEVYRSLFEERRKGGVWRAMMFSIADVFPEDRLAIYEMFKQPEREKNSNPPNITRGEKSSYRAPNDCEGCPGNGREFVGYNPSGQKMRVIKKGKSEKPFSTVADVLERFEGSLPAMLAYAEDNGISISGKIKKPESAAAVIVEHYKSQA